MLFAGWEVRTMKNCDLGPENAALGRTDQPLAGKYNILLFFSCSKLVLQIITNGFFTQLCH